MTVTEAQANNSIPGRVFGGQDDLHETLREAISARMARRPSRAQCLSAPDILAIVLSVLKSAPAEPVRDAIELITESRDELIRSHTLPGTHRIDDPAVEEVIRHHGEVIRKLSLYLAAIDPSQMAAKVCAVEHVASINTIHIPGPMAFAGLAACGHDAARTLMGGIARVRDVHTADTALAWFSPIVAWARLNGFAWVQFDPAAAIVGDLLQYGDQWN